MLRGDAGNDALDGGSGTDTAYFSGNRAEYQVTTARGITEVKDLRGGRPDGIDQVSSIERLAFADGVVFLVPNRDPDAMADTASTNEDAAVDIAVASNDADADADNLIPVSITDADPGTLGFQTALGATISIVGGSVRYDPSTSAALQALGGGASVQDSFEYTISDGFGGTDTASVYRDWRERRTPGYRQLCLDRRGHRAQHRRARQRHGH